MIATAGALAVWLFTMPASVTAQSYPGLIGGGAQGGNQNRGSAQQEQPGYRGLMSGTVTPRTSGSVQQNSQQPSAADSQNPENVKRVDRNTYYGQTPVKLPEQNQNALRKQSFPDGMAPPSKVETAEGLKLASVIAKSAENGKTSLPNVRLNERALKVLNAPLEKENGAYPKERRTMRYVNMMMDQIAGAPKNERRDRIQSFKSQIESMIDNNNARMAIPDAVSERLGMTPAAISARKNEAEAVNARLQNVLDRLN